MNIKSIVQEYYDWLKQNPNTYGVTPDKFIDAMVKHNKDFHFHFTKLCKEKEKKEYYYLVTFTVRDDVDEDEDVIEQYIKKQFLRSPLHVVVADIVKERTKRDRPHWHVSTIMHCCLKKDRFQYYQKLYGSIDISKSGHKSYETILNYLSKDGLPQNIKGFRDSNLTRNPPPKESQK